MEITRLSSTELKRNTAEVLNSVAFGKIEIIIERYGKPLVKIVPIALRKKNSNLKGALGRSYGAAPDFPPVSKLRRSR